MRRQGWYRDPFGIHDDRWFSGGQPTSLVRDRGIESYDQPPQDRPGQDLPQQGEPLLPVSGHLKSGRWPAAWAGTELEWRWWTVLLPGLVTLAAWGVTFRRPPLFIVAELSEIALITAGLRIPRWRPAIAIVLWAAFVLFCICVVLVLFALSQLSASFN